MQIAYWDGCLINFEYSFTVEMIQTAIGREESVCPRYVFDTNLCIYIYIFVLLSKGLVDYILGWSNWGWRFISENKNFVLIVIIFLFITIKMFNYYNFLILDYKFKFTILNKRNKYFYCKNKSFYVQLNIFALRYFFLLNCYIFSMQKVRCFPQYRWHYILSRI